MAESLEKKVVEKESFSPETLSISPDSKALETRFEEEFSRTEKMAESEAEKLNATPEDMSSLREKLASLRTETGKILERFKIAAAIAVFAGSLEAAPPVEKGLEVFSEDEVRRMVLEDENEKAFLIVSDLPSSVIKLAEGEGASTPTYDLGPEESNALENLTGDSEDGTFAHTHPLSAYRLLGYSDQDLERWRITGELPPAIAPSMPDLIQLRETSNLAGEEDICTRIRVYGTTGIWEAEGEPTGRLKKVQEFGSRVDGILRKFYASLDTTELKERFDSQAEKATPLKGVKAAQWGFIEEDPELRARFEPYGKEISKLIDESGDAFSDMEKLNEMQLATAHESTHQQAAKEYAKFLSESGVNLTFRPYSEKE